ncbi:MAG: LemA family protein [Eubacteriales bacterium]|jgi:LemA protein|nr:LemA family protein [Eubacteriales bacterium]MDD3197486.1 LemA family protein [Eubacteriales bacterium]MDD3504172.1 LemA family protein [Eubacteriales bacterium]MDD4682480.1 LemA family protein [Eubacteriales bacterium]
MTQFIALALGSGLIGLLIAAAVVVLLLLWLAGTYNSFIRKRNVVDESFSTMDVYLKKRFDLIPNIVETVKGYASHEKETLAQVVKARSMISEASTPEQRLAGENALTGTLRSLFAVAEAYPDLKANTNFLNLQTQLSDIENDIAQSRKYYNACVRDFNIKAESFPSNIIAGMFGFKKFPMFEVENEQERQNVKVQF